VSKASQQRTNTDRTARKRARARADDKVAIATNWAPDFGWDTIEPEAEHAGDFACKYDNIRTASNGRLYLTLDVPAAYWNILGDLHEKSDMHVVFVRTYVVPPPVFTPFELQEDLSDDASAG
jgi:hypothetical protein